MEIRDNFRELEYKYRADEVKLPEFDNLMDELNYKKKIDASSWDVYYTKSEEDKDLFIRYRMSNDRPELTKKRKIKASNNWARIEVDLPLDPDRIDEKTVERFVGLDNYEKNFKIYKSCFIYFFEFVNTVWYSVYDENMKEKGRFIEVEVNKDKLEELGKDAITMLNEYEQKLNCLGITPQHRLRKSLFEMYRK